ncbi:MAG TPA: SDR family NAD(P)-dependent oxidoreductase [Myxococcota bacterium]|nr:SDR family NAD(P)-dependent oxidoreductase [Myxococcota bacterium]
MGLLDGKVAIVTGAGGGLGRCHALLFAKEGAAVVVNDLGGARDGAGGGHSMADQVVKEIKAAGGQAVANYDSVATVEGGNNICKTAVDAFGKVDILVNNAGILRDKTLVNTDEASWDIVIQVHLKGTYCVTRPVFTHMKERGQGGVIVNTSSTSGLIGNFGQSNYGAAKAGIAGFTRCLALEGKKYNIRVWGLAPVAVTRLTEDLPGMANDNVKQMLAPEKVSPAVLYMVSDLSKDKTGKFLFVSGNKVTELKIVGAEGFKNPNGVSAQEIAANESKVFLPESQFNLMG